MKLNHRLLLVAVLIGGLLAGCRDSDRDKDNTWQSCTDYALSHQLFMDVVRQAHAFSVRDTIVSAPSDTLAQMGCLDTVYYSTTTGSVPTAVTLDFGSESDNTCSDGRARMGSLSIDYETYYNGSGSVVTISPQGYTMDDYRVSGAFVLTQSQVGTDSTAAIYTLTITDGVASKDDWRVEYTGTYSFTWTSGISSTDPSDDSFVLNGGGAGRNSKGADFTAETVIDLGLTLDCKWFKSGKVEIQPANLRSRELVYGNGTCDAIVNLSRNNTLEEFELLP